ncbi:MAG: alpha/beta fold hydrolase [Phycisphaeraceae bacterium]|nr:alpha/beta fold hydrolase [Phycisphaeraceae bacterium]
MPSLALNWGTLAVEDSQGRGMPLVFLHGSGCDLADWDPVIAALPASQRTIRMDFRGHGQSSVPKAVFTITDLADDVLALADHLRIPRFVLVGHSLGGMVAMELARRSGRAAGLVLLEGWTKLTCTRAFTGDRFFGQLDPKTIADIQQKSQTTRQRFDPRLWTGFWQSVEAFNGYSVLQKARVPIWEVYGDLGRTADTQRLLEVPENPRIGWVWLAGAGHYLPTEKPQAVAEICGQAVAAM